MKNFFKFITVLGVLLSSSLLSYAQPPEKNEIERAVKLSFSSKASDRIMAIKWFLQEKSVDLPFDVLHRLIADSDLQVRDFCLLAVNSVSGRANYAPEESRILYETCQKELSKYPLDSINLHDFNQPQANLMISYLIAVNSLCLWYPVISPISYEVWLNEVYAPSLRKLSGYRGKGFPEFDQRVGGMVYNLNGPTAIEECLPILLDTYSSDITTKYLEELWGNPFCGENRPLNAILKIYLKKNFNQIETRCRGDKENLPLSINRILDQIKAE